MTDGAKMAADNFEAAAELAREGDGRRALRAAFVGARLLDERVDGKFGVRLLPVCPDCGRPMPESGADGVEWACLICDFVLVGGESA